MTTFRFRGEERPTAASRASILVPATDEGGQAAELYLYDPIDSWGEWWGVSAKEFAAALALLPEDVSEIRLHINSPGGEVFEASAIVNLLRRHKARTVAVVDGLAASAASVLAVTCDELVMGVGTQLMIHDAWNIEVGNEAAMLAMAGRLSKDSDMIAALYAEKAGGTVEEWRELMRAETWYTAGEAVAAGLADRAEGTPTEGVPNGAKASFDLSPFRYAGRESAPAPKPVARAGARGVTAHQSPVSSEPGQHNRKENPVDHAEFLNGLRSRLGVNAEVDEAVILAAVDEALSERADEQAPTATEPPEGTVLVDAAQFAELQAQAAEGAQARAQQVSDRRDAIVDGAIREGRIAPANRATWRASLDTSEEGTKAILETMPKSAAVPVVEVGVTGGIDDADDALYNRVVRMSGGSNTKEA